MHLSSLFHSLECNWIKESMGKGEKTTKGNENLN